MSRFSRAASVVAAGAAAAIITATATYAVIRPDFGSVEFGAADTSVEAVSQLGRELIDAGSTGQGGALEDGVITASEYRAAFDALRSCVEDAGPTVSDAVISPIDGYSLVFSYDAAGVDTTAAVDIYDRCEGRHWQPLAQLYSAVSTSSMNPDLASAVSDCLATQEQAVPTEATSLEAFFDQRNDAEHQQKVVDCISDEVSRLFPDLPAVIMEIPPVG